MNKDYLNYLRLINDVLTIDINAAKYLLISAPKFPGFNYSGSLYELFNWENTPQGSDYWHAISNKL